MTTRPRAYRGSKLHGLIAVALFALLAGIFLAADVGEPSGFAGVASITAAIGYAMFDIEAAVVPDGTESFLVAFEIIDVVLVAALAAAVMLARRESEMALPFSDDGDGAGSADAEAGTDDGEGSA